MELTSLELNNTIVRFRRLVGQAKYRLTSKLIRRVKALKSKTTPEKSESLLKKYKNKLERYVEEVQALKRLKPDDVSKFALLNTKTLQELKITSGTPPSDRVLFKVATVDLLVLAVEEFREKYPNWHREVPFILQRLGLQYKFRKGEREASGIKDLLKTMQVSNVDEDDKAENAAAENVEIEVPKESLLAKIKARQKEEKMAKKKKGKKWSKLDKGSHADVKKRKVKRRKKNEDGPKKVSSPGQPATSTNLERTLGAVAKEEQSYDSGKEDNSATSPQQHDPFFIVGEMDRKTKSADSGFFIDKRRWRKDSNVEEESKTRPERMDKPRKRTLGVDSKRGARSSRTEGKQKRMNGGNIIADKPSAKSTAKPDGVVEEQSASLHPSWEAKRKQRLLEKSQRRAAPVGKKIKFDDD